MTFCFLLYYSTEIVARDRMRFYQFVGGDTGPVVFWNYHRAGFKLVSLGPQSTTGSMISQLTVEFAP